jgi:hypothetical protein
MPLRTPGEILSDVIGTVVEQPLRSALTRRVRLFLCTAGAAVLGALLLAPASAATRKGAVLVKDISPGDPRRSSSSGSPYEFTNVAGTLYFAAYDRSMASRCGEAAAPARGREWSRTSAGAVGEAATPRT